MARLGRGQPRNVIIVRGSDPAFPQTITLTGIASAEAFGTAAIQFAQTVSPSGIASAEAFGTSQLNLTIALTGIASSEAIGSPVIGASTIAPEGIASSEAMGSPTVIIQQFVSPTGIAAAEAFGDASLQVGYPQTVTLTGIASEGSAGTPEVRLLYRYLLVTDGVQETPAGYDDHGLFVRYGIHRGISILLEDGVYREVRYPSLDEIREADAYYRGGGRHRITAEEAAGLNAAGFGDLITLELDT